MSQPHDSATTLLAKGSVVTYTGASIGGISMPDWAAIMAGLVSLCILIQYMWRGVLWIHQHIASLRGTAND